jgi:hypothetical protein
VVKGAKGESYTISVEYGNPETGTSKAWHGRRSNGDGPKSLQGSGKAPPVVTQRSSVAQSAD